MASAVLLLTACADTDIPGFNFGEPESMYSEDSLNSYDVLKNYIDRDKYPNFKLGGETNAATFNTLGKVYALDKANYDEVVTGNAFKYGSIVADDGQMDFSTVQTFVKNASAAGLSVFGHNLVWHSQQNVKYLNSLITDPNAANYVFHWKTEEAKTNTWDYSCSLQLSEALKSGADYTVKMRIKTSVPDQTITCWPSLTGGATQYWPTPSIVSKGTEWTNITSSFTAKQDINVIGFEFGTYAGDIWIDDVSVTDADGKEYCANGNFDEDYSGWSKPSWIDYTMERAQDPDQGANGGGITPEIQRDTLTWAMNKWISGMMKACDGKVQSWDLINEPMSDNVPSELKTAGRDGDPKKDFFWQDYLGKDYARIAARLAREAAGDTVQLKLFVNDYNLEAAYNHNAKCDGLINMIKYWESDGVTKIDGIGSQMHVTYSMNPETQKRNEEAYVNMLQKLAATGKLIRISELDMGLTGVDGKTIHTADVTPEEHQAMAQYYKFIVEKYLEIIPAAQQYGIVNWGVTDSPADSGWRADEPIGLWDINYNRKPAYAGFADGLAGK